MTLQQQYNSIKEGKGDRTNFLKNAKFQFPNLFNAYTSYEDSVNVLKSKGLITEGVGGVVTGGREQDWVKIFKQNISEEAKAEEKKMSKEAQDMQSTSFDYKDLKNIDNVYGQSFLEGFYAEMQDPKNEEKTTNEVKAIVAKNLAKDRLYYTKDGMFGIKGIGYTTEAPGLGTPKEPKGKFKSSGYGDLKESKPGYKPAIGSTGHFHLWKNKLYSIIMSDTGLDKEDIAVDEFEIKKYWEEGKTPEEVYNNIWSKDAGNYLNIGEGLGTSLDQDMLQPKNIALQIQDTVPANYTDEDLADAIDMYLTQAAVSPQVYDRDIKPNFGQWMSNVKNELNRLQMANNPGVDKVGDMLRTSTDRYTKLREAIREMILQELNEETPAADAVDKQIDAVEKQLGALYTKKGQELSKPGTGS